MSEFELPEGMQGVTPHLVCEGAADALDFYSRAFGAEELVRLPGPDGRLLHAAMRINGCGVMLVDAFPEHGSPGPKALGGTPVTINLFVPDADAWADRAVAAGCSVVMPVDLQFWGDRYGIVQDPFGHLWAIATPAPAGPRTREELEGALAAMSGSKE